MRLTHISPSYNLLIGHGLIIRHSLFQALRCVVNSDVKKARGLEREGGFHHRLLPQIARRLFLLRLSFFRDVPTI